MHYDALGRVDWTKDALGGQTTNTFDVRGNVVRTTYRDGTETRTAFDPMGRVTWTTDRFATTADDSAVTVVTHTLYDSLGRVTGTERYRNQKIVLTDEWVDGQLPLRGRHD
jgi:YD repeat-containing protein